MKLLSKITKSQHFKPLLIVLAFALLASKGLIGTGYFNMHDDLQMMRQLEMEKCFNDGQIPCRWVPDMGYGYGFPLFNFYPPLPYLVGMVPRIFNVTFVDTVKLLFIFAFVASGITMYFLVQEFLGKKAGVLAAILYIWAPYHSVDIYVRGALNEAWALIFFPALLYTSYKLLSNTEKKIDKKYIFLLALSWFGLLTSHNLMVMIFAPVYCIWVLLFFLRFRSTKNLFLAGISSIWGLGLASFFTLPVFVEQKFVHADTLVQGYYDYSGHFASLNQLFITRFWGYGPSVWLEADKMSFQIGHIHWIVTVVSTWLLIFSFFKKKKNMSVLIAVSLMLAVGWFAAFMTHSRSTPIWITIPPLKFVQFPWRFLTLTMLGFSISGAYVLYKLPNRLKTIFLIAISALIVIVNYDYFKPEYGKLGPLTDSEKFNGAAWDLQRTAGIFDYLPKTAKENPRDGKYKVAEVVKGDVTEIMEATEGTNWASFKVNTNKESLIRINTYLFPDWKVFIDGKETQISIPKEEKWGRIHITVPSGVHNIYAKLYDTPIRTVGNTISLFSWLLLIFFIMKKLTRKVL